MKKMVIFAAAILGIFDAAAAKFFVDVSPENPHFAAIATLESRGVVRGFDDGTFHPEKAVSRAAALKMILKAAGVRVTGVAVQKPFPDVPTDAWFAPIAKKGRDLKIVRGDKNGNFLPAKKVSRAEAIAMLFRTNGDDLKKPEKKPFSDVPTDAWFAPAFAAAKKTGLLRGEKADPSHFLTRGELSDLIFRFFKREWAENAFSGKISFYADFFDGKRTASGEIFRKNDFTAAHRRLDFGTKIRVKNRENEKSVVVRVNDRGPYAAGRILDLSPTAFSAIAPASRGVITGDFEIVDRETPLGPAPKCDFSKMAEKIPPDFFENLKLISQIPKSVPAGTEIIITGKVLLQNPPPKIVFFHDGKTAEIPLFGGIFRVPVIFEKAGQSKISFFVGKNSGKIAEIKVFEKKCDFDDGKMVAPPKNLRFSTKKDETTFSWDAGENKIFRLEFSQNEKKAVFFIFGKNEFIAIPSAFSGFHRGIATVKISGAPADENGAPTGGFSFGEEKIIPIENHLSRRNNVLNAEISDDFEIEKPIKISGTTTEKLAEKMIVIDPDEHFFEVPIAKNGEKFSAEFLPKKRGNYIVEINDAGGLALFVAGVAPRGFAPIVPDFFDKNAKIEAVAPENRAEKLKNWISTARKIRGLSGLQIDENLTDLAQFRADDMIARNYFGHTDPDGKTAADYRVLKNVKTPIGENIAKNRTLRAAHEFLMRSPAHRQNLLNPAWTRVGFGFSEKDGQLLVVEIFGSDPFEEKKIGAWREKFLKKINAARQADPIVPKARLEAIAQKWAQKEAAENFLGFSRGDESLEKMLAESGVTATAKAIVLQISNLDELLTQIDKPEIVFDDFSQKNIFLEKTFQNLGIGIAQSEDWQLFVVLIATE